MSVRHRLIALAAAATAVALGILPFATGGDSLESRVRDKGLSAGDLGGFKLKRETTHNIKGKTVTEIHAAGAGGTEIKLTVIENARDSAVAYTDQRVFDLNSQFNRGVSPYPGVVSQLQQCPQSFLPRVQSAAGAGWEGRTISLFANSRRQFGVCEEKERTFDVTVLILTCAKSGHIFDFTVFTRSGGPAPASRFESLACL